MRNLKKKEKGETSRNVSSENVLRQIVVLGVVTCYNYATTMVDYPLKYPDCSAT